MKREGVIKDERERASKNNEKEEKRGIEEGREERG